MQTFHHLMLILMQVAKTFGQMSLAGDFSGPKAFWVLVAVANREG